MSASGFYILTLMDMLTNSSILRRNQRGIRPAELIKLIASIYNYELSLDYYQVAE
jgi:hypothetical protein